MRRLVAAAAMAAVGLATIRASAQVPPAAPYTLALGDWQLMPSADLRTRGEYRHAPVDVGGAASGGLVDDTFLAMERARLGMGAEYAGVLRAQITLQDAHAWGAEPATGTVNEGGVAGETGAYEAYIELHTKDARPSFLRIGRQAVTWGEGRLVSASDWSPTGRSLDAIRGRLSRGAWDVEVLGAVLEAQQPLGVQFENTGGPQTGGSELVGAQVAWTLDPLAKIELTGLGRFTQKPSAASTPPSYEPRFDQALAQGQTYVLSLRIAGEGHSWRYGAEGAYELGRATSMGCMSTTIEPEPGGLSCSAESRSAFAGAAHVSHTFDSLLLTPSLRIGGAYASGDDGSSTYKQFDPLLPDVHTWHGAMDIFAWSNEIEGNARVTIVPWTEATISAEYRFAELARASGDWLNAYLGVVGSAPGNTSAELGHEIDGVFTWRPWPVFGVVAGYSALVLGDGAKAILAEPTVGRGKLQSDGTYLPAGLSHLAYLQATLTIP